MSNERWSYDGDAGRWCFWRRRPAAALSGFVVELQAYWESGGRPLVRKELPSGLIPLIIVWSPDFALADSREVGGWRPLSCSFTAGLASGPASVASSGEALCLQVDFTPLGARRFFRSDLDALTDRVIAFEELSPDFATELEGRLFHCAGWEARLDLLERLVTRRVLGAAGGDPRVAAAYCALTASEGALAVSALADRLDLSRKHLNSLFKREIGLSPKRFARTLRFGAAVTRLSTPEGLSLAQVAADCGYADQSHFTRDFKVFAGETPQALRRRIVPGQHSLLL